MYCEKKKGLQLEVGLKSLNSTGMVRATMAAKVCSVAR